MLELLCRNNDIANSVSERQSLCGAQYIWVTMAGRDIESDVSTREQGSIRHGAAAEINGDRWRGLSRFYLQLLGEKRKVPVTMMCEARSKTRSIKVVRSDPGRRVAGCRGALAARGHAHRLAPKTVHRSEPSDARRDPSAVVVCSCRLCTTVPP